jgi:hypothetical protein
MAGLAVQIFVLCGVLAGLAALIVDFLKALPDGSYNPWRK